jgi:dihydroorotate dehydrogenase electron transfer subunit
MTLPSYRFHQPLTTGTKMAEYQGQIVNHTQIQERYWRLELHCPTIAQQALPGQFIHILSPVRSGFDPLLRRAFSIFSTSEDSFEVLYRVEGRGTWALSQAQVGETVNFLGPLGVTFAYTADNFVTHDAQQALLVGGGVGVPPMAFLARFLQEHLQPQQIMAFIGARSQADIVALDAFRDLNIPVQLTTDDGSAGRPGLITVPLQEQLMQCRAQGIVPIVYACGPWPMLRSVAALCRDYEVPCQVSLEENMPCGIGVCNGCVIPVQGAGDDYGQYRRICVEGPVLWSHEVQWEKPLTSCA